MNKPREPLEIGRCRFGQYDCAVLLGNYQAPPHPHALILMGRGQHAGEPIAVASVFIDFDADNLAPDEVCIKNWSENEGIREVLQTAGIIGPALRSVCPDPTPREQIPATVHKLLAGISTP